MIIMAITLYISHLQSEHEKLNILKLVIQSNVKYVTNSALGLKK